MNAPVESTAEIRTDDAGEARYWIDELHRAEQGRRKWCERGRKIVKRYKDERDGSTESVRRINFLWSNVETLKPALYARTPKPEVARRFLDKDPIGKTAADVLERTLAAAIDLYDFDDTLRLCVQDYLLPGRGQAWVRYNPTFQGEQLAYEEVLCEYVPWEDYLEAPARHWGEVRWVAKRAYLTRDEAVKLSPKHGKVAPLDHKPSGMDTTDPQKLEAVAKMTVWEIWDRTDKKIRYINPGYGDAPLAVKPVPFDLRGGFPCPRPLQTTTATDSRIPVPDYAQYQDQADELDDLTARITALQKAVKVVGVYDSSATGLQRILNEGVENAMVPVDSWAAFAEKGGLKGAVDFLPVDQVVAALLQLYEAREKVKQDLYEVTGLSDILRGASEASETATAQQIKTQWGSLRVRDRQAEVQRFARDLIRIKGEIVAEVFQPQTLAAMSGVQQMGPEYQQTFDAAMQLLRQDAARNFRIDIETDSTIQPDEDAEKQRRVEFLTASAQFLEGVVPVVQALPQAAPMVGAMLSFGVRGFRAGREVEQAVETLVQQMQTIAQQPSPQQVQAQQEAQAKQQETEAAQQQQAMAEQQAQRDHEHRMAQETTAQEQERTKQADLIVKAQADAEERQRAHALKVQELDQRGTIETAKLNEAKEARQFTRQAAVEDRQAEQQPEREAVKPVVEAVQKIGAALDAVLGKVEQVTEKIDAAAQQVAELVDEANAPREVVRDEQGRAVGVKAGKRTRQVVRGEDGRVTGLN